MASIRERNGKFNVIYSYTDPDGKRKQKWETYATKAEAKKRKKEIEYKEEIYHLSEQHQDVLFELHAHISEHHRVK